MIEHQERRKHPIAIVNDDTNCKRAIDNAALLGLPNIHFQVMFAHDSEYPYPRDFVSGHRDFFLSHEYGAHLSLFAGRKPAGPNGVFGKGGRIDRNLRAIESLRRRSVSLGIARNISSSRDLEWARPYIVDEYRSQIELAIRWLGVKPYYLTHHYGIHFFDIVWDALETVAEEYGIPHRIPVQYIRKPTEHAHLAFRDELNIPPIFAKKLKRILHDIRSKNKPAEVCIHIADNGKTAQAQMRAFQDRDVRTLLEEHFVIEQPHTILQSMK